MKKVQVLLQHFAEEMYPNDYTQSMSERTALNEQLV